MEIYYIVPGDNMAFAQTLFLVAIAILAWVIVETIRPYLIGEE